jgi:hypothetical protein
MTRLKTAKLLVGLVCGASLFVAAQLTVDSWAKGVASLVQKRLQQ